MKSDAAEEHFICFPHTVNGKELSMELIVHLSGDFRENLKKTSAKLHADTVIRVIQRLSMPAENKRYLLERILAAWEKQNPRK